MTRRQGKDEHAWRNSSYPLTRSRFFDIIPKESKHGFASLLLDKNAKNAFLNMAKLSKHRKLSLIAEKHARKENIINKWNSLGKLINLHFKQHFDTEISLCDPSYEQKKEKTPLIQCHNVDDDTKTEKEHEPFESEK